MSIRIGIDVGGTFTDAVAIDNDTLNIIGFVKVFTTHSSSDGVAEGIVSAILKLISSYNINPSDISIIVAGTTQATNALLEGDVSLVGVVFVGNFCLSSFNDINLYNDKFIPVKTYTIAPNNNFDEQLKVTFDKIKASNIRTIVATSSFSNDNPIFEKKVVDYAISQGIYATATHEISQLYGIKIRTTTAIINACILPKMVTTFDLIKSSIEKINISAPIMIMRCDGGIMPIEELKKRPFLTILSGPCASVYGALIYEKISTGVFLEVGGTSTDISVIKNGDIMSSHAQIGNHTLYLNSLDIHTTSVAGGSLIRISTKNTLDIGPRSAHILGLKYACFANPSDLENITLTFIQSDGLNYVGVKNSSGDTFALTLTCVCNALSLISKDDYCFGNTKAARLAMDALAKYLNKPQDDLAYEILDIAINKCIPIVNSLVLEYQLDPKNLKLFGGGGASLVLVPSIAKKINASYKICKNAPIISSIGVSLSVLREEVEKSIINPSLDDIKSLKLLVQSKLLESGANPDSIETYIDFDKTKNILRATASGSLDISFSQKTTLTTDELSYVIVSHFKLTNENITLKYQLGKHSIFSVSFSKKMLFGLINKQSTLFVIIDSYGIIRFSNDIKLYTTCSNVDILGTLPKLLKDNSLYGDFGVILPKCIVVTPSLILDLSSFSDLEQMISLVKSQMTFEQSFDVGILIF